MKTYAVSAPDFLDPFWFNRVRHGEHAGEIADDGTVTIEAVGLRLRDAPLAPGTAVRVWLSTSGYFVCATLEEIELDRQARCQAEQARDERARQMRNAMREQAEAFNARIALPVSWDVGIKDVLSALTERSWGDGRNRATVHHIRLLEPLRAGQFVRNAGDFLCTSAKGSNGKCWSGQRGERWHDGEGTAYAPKVTCKSCLAMAKRWMT
jgi:hypothetical protein